MTILEPESRVRISGKLVNYGVRTAETESGSAPDVFVAGPPVPDSPRYYMVMVRDFLDIGPSYLEAG